MSQSLSQILVHIVFSTKKRVQFLGEAIRPEMHLYLAGILKKLGCAVYGIGGTDNHIHILCEVAVGCLLPDLVNKLKSGSSNWMKKTKMINEFYWQRGYGIFSVSNSQKPIIENYIRNQIQHHKKFSFEDEFRSMLQKCGIQYNEKYLWD